VGWRLPETTRAGEARAAAWRGYARGIQSAARGAIPVSELDDALPYAVALGVARATNRHLADARRAGYSQSWLGPDARSWRLLAVDGWMVGTTDASATSSWSGGGDGGSAGAGGASGGGSF
jgi:hypothetical protein